MTDFRHRTKLGRIIEVWLGLGFVGAAGLSLLVIVSTIFTRDGAEFLRTHSGWFIVWIFLLINWGAILYNWGDIRGLWDVVSIEILLFVSVFGLISFMGIAAQFVGDWLAFLLLIVVMILIGMFVDRTKKKAHIMTSFNTDGFLSADISEVEESIAARYAEKFDLAFQANRLAHQVIYSAQISNKHLPDLLLASLLTRQAACFQGFFILLRKGLLIQAQIILRNLAETMFITGAIRKDETFAEYYVMAEDVTRKKSLEALVRDNQRQGKKVDQETIDLVAALDIEIKNRGITAFSTERIAQIAELSSYYDSLYRLTSMAVHTSTRGLDKTLETDGDGNVVSLNYEPAVDDLDMYLDFGISIMLYTLHEIASHFELPVDNIEILQQKNNQLAGTGR